MSEFKPECENQQLGLTDEQDGIARDSQRYNLTLLMRNTLMKMSLYVENPWD